ncbi:MAG: hypothetical protein ABIS06_02310 [Vicinamibacterales bacterium]
MQFRHVGTPVKSLPGEPEVRLRSFDLHTRVDTIFSARHVLSTLIAFPREIKRVTMNTFRPEGTTPDFDQKGWSIGGVDRLSIVPDAVLETTVSVRQFEIEVTSENTAPMVYAPETQSGGFFNDQERDVRSYQWVEALSLSKKLWSGEHVFKFGADLQRSEYNGTSLSRPVEIRRRDGSLAERDRLRRAVDATRHGDRVCPVCPGPLAGERPAHPGGWIARRPRRRHRRGELVAASRRRVVDSAGRARHHPRRLRKVCCADAAEHRRLHIVRSAHDHAVGRRRNADGQSRDADQPGDGAVADARSRRRQRRMGPAIRPPDSSQARLSCTQGVAEYVVSPDPAAGALRLSSSGDSRYRELESTVRYLRGERRDLTLSYVWAKGEADLNNYDEFFGNLRNPIIRANEHDLISSDVRHRLLLRGTIGLPWQWDFAPVVELRSGFPWSAVNEFQDFVGPRSRTGRLPAVHTIDFSLVRPWHFRKYNFRAGHKVYSLLGATVDRDIQSNTTSPFYGTAYNPVQRSFGFVFSTGK